LRFEANTQEQLDDIKDQFITALAPFYEKAYLIKNLA
jgi:hypothetical protein